MASTAHGFYFIRSTMREFDDEAVRVLEACDSILNSPTYNDTINEESYKVAKSIMSAGKGKICQYCICNLKGECPWTMTVRVKKRYCLRAYYRKLRKEYGIDGQKTNIKTGVD